MSATAAANTKLALDFVEVVLKGRNFDPVAKCLTEDLCCLASFLHPQQLLIIGLPSSCGKSQFANHRGPHTTQGRNAFVAIFKNAQSKFMPNFNMTVIRTVADDEQVWVHSTISGLLGGASQESVDIFTVKDGLLAEKWDVQTPPAKLE